MNRLASAAREFACAGNRLASTARAFACATRANVCDVHRFIRDVHRFVGAWLASSAALRVSCATGGCAGARHQQTFATREAGGAANSRIEPKRAFVSAPCGSSGATDALAEIAARSSGVVQRFVGVNRADFQKLFALLQDHVEALENTVRWRWQAGDVAIWDNSATQHYAVNDYGDQHRVVRRVTIEGDVPVSIDGRRSRARGAHDKADSIAAE